MKLLNVKSVEEVLKIIEENFLPIARYEKLGLNNCLGRILGEDIFSPEILPPYSRSSVDGFAVIATDTYGASESLPAFLELKGDIQMGKMAGSIQFGETKYIPTGGMLPEGADGVVMVEYTEKIGNQIMLYRQAAPGENVIKAGDDVQQGELVLEKGTSLNEAAIGVLAALGIKEVKTFQRPVVGILSTGNELVPYQQEKLELGQIRDINSITLASIAQKCGAEVIQGGIISDNLDQILIKAQELLDKVDILLLSGGSSVGTLDFTSQVVKELGEGELLVEGISVKPGKPTLFSKKGTKAIWGLPGHPVSAMMIFHFFGKRMLNLLAGVKENKITPKCKAFLSRNVPSSAGRTDWVRVKLTYDGEKYLASPIFAKSGLIKTLSDSHGFIEISAAKEGLEAGSWVEVILWK